ncbi:MAG: FkbM family methyltransferase [Chloroflexi bacterium]|nr:FkbM family methyltransferase [Chloroflexota bacterium]
MWTEQCRKWFPEAFYFLIEAQKPHEPDLITFKRRRSNVDYIIAAAGDVEGQIYFDATNLMGGAASHTPFEKNCIIVPVTTVDIQVSLKNLLPPFLIKLDTHGFEVPILEGAKQTLKQTELIVMEVYNFNIVPNSLRFHEMCAYMESQGFRCIDLCDPRHRPRDGALWQFDLFFARSENPIFASNNYK